MKGKIKGCSITYVGNQPHSILEIEVPEFHPADLQGQPCEVVLPCCPEDGKLEASSPVEPDAPVEPPPPAAAHLVIVSPISEESSVPAIPAPSAEEKPPEEHAVEQPISAPAPVEPSPRS